MDDVGSRISRSSAEDQEQDDRDDGTKDTSKRSIDEDGLRLSTSHPFEPHHVTIGYPDGPSNEYLAECLIPVIHQELTDWTVSCSLRSTSIQSLVTQLGANREPPTQLVGAIQWSDYDLIDWSLLKSFPDQTLFNAYPIRKALIRKNYLVKAIERYHIKTSIDPTETSSRSISIPKSYTFTLSFSDELDELWLDELYDLHCDLAKQEEANFSSRSSDDCQKIWILKPALADRGQGIRLFRTRDQLYEIFREFESADDDDDQASEPEEEPQAAHEDDASAHELTKHGSDHRETLVSLSQMRDWIIQEYISNPILINPDDLTTYSKDPKIDRSNLRKHHLRVYVLAVGALSVYVFEDILSLFSAKPFDLKDLADLKSHLTNTCLQQGSHLPIDPDDEPKDGSAKLVHCFSKHPQEVLGQIDSIVANLFRFVAQTDQINLQLNPNCFEIFGLDFLVDQDLKVWLLEINSGPDFSQTGPDLKKMIARLFQGTVRILKAEFSLSNSHHSLRRPQSSPKPDHQSSSAGFRQVLNLQTNLSFL